MKTPFSLRIPDELQEKLKAEAQKTKRSLSNLIILIITEYFEKKETK